LERSIAHRILRVGLDAFTKAAISASHRQERSAKRCTSSATTRKSSRPFASGGRLNGRIQRAGALVLLDV
jgi:hypothetical protein